MESYAVSNNYLRENADQFSEEDLAALQAAMAEEDPESNNNNDELAEDEDAEGDSAELSYDALLRLGEQIGNVKEERWALGAQEQINRLPTLTWNAQMAVYEVCILYRGGMDDFIEWWAIEEVIL